MSRIPTCPRRQKKELEYQRYFPVQLPSPHGWMLRLINAPPSVRSPDERPKTLSKLNALANTDTDTHIAASNGRHCLTSAAAGPPLTSRLRAAIRPLSIPRRWTHTPMLPSNACLRFPCTAHLKATTRPHRLLLIFAAEIDDTLCHLQPHVARGHYASHSLPTRFAVPSGVAAKRLLFRNESFAIPRIVGVFADESNAHRSFDPST
ncbi:hypothetical protein Mal33_43270 [Rosistilla oblonga]|uniref:Uncharacterized protein n=1 Tax=Rosistilla oblonga TaxID=2527990 RepID=A0A518IZ03_9BACT|nr:hypothetical protein Mal33_43270 [Rosistilla oblonga]